jgi:hypothetical protein
MTLGTTESADCEVEGCDHPRGARLRAILTYGCVLCVHHENLYQKGEIDLPESANEERRQSAEAILLGA